MTTDNFCFYLQNRPIQTSQTGGQQNSDTSPFSIPYCTIDLQFDWFGISRMTTDIFFLQNRLIQTSQTGGQRNSYTSPFSILWVLPSSALFTADCLPLRPEAVFVSIRDIVPNLDQISS